MSPMARGRVALLTIVTALASVALWVQFWAVGLREQTAALSPGNAPSGLRDEGEPRLGQHAMRPTDRDGVQELAATPAISLDAELPETWQHALTAERPRGQARQELRCSTTKGPFRVRLYPELAPNGTAFLTGLARAKYFDQTGGVAFFRVNKHITQFGVSKRVPREEDPFIEFRRGAIRDLNPDPARKTTWPRGTMASIGGFHFLIVIRANRQMGLNRHDAPLGIIPEEDMVNTIDKLFAYNDIINSPKKGPGPDQTRLMREGIEYIDRDFPLTDRILGCELQSLS